MGIVTASEMATVMANGKNGEASKTRRTYMLKLAGEIITGEPMESYCNGHMERGIALEPEARDFYSFMNDVQLTKVGLIVNGPKACGPDSLIGDKGILEIKTALPHILIELLLKDEFPPAHKAQCQGQLWIAEFYRQNLENSYKRARLGVCLRRWTSITLRSGRKWASKSPRPSKM